MNSLFIKIKQTLKQYSINNQKYGNIIDTNALSTTGGMANNIHTMISRGRKLSYLDDYTEMIEKLSAKEVNAAIKQYMSPDNIIISASNNMKPLLDELQLLYGGTINILERESLFRITDYSNTQIESKLPADSFIFIHPGNANYIRAG